MIKPEVELLLAVLEKKIGKNGNTYWTGFMGLNTVYVSEYDNKLWIKLQKWPKKEQPLAPVGQNGFNQKPSYGEEDVPF